MINHMANLVEISIVGGIVTYFFSIFSGGIIISFLSMAIGITKKIKFYEKHALQMLSMSFWALLCYIVLEIVLGYLFIKFLKFPLDLTQLKDVFFKSSILKLDIASILASFALIVMLFLLKNRIKNFKGVFVFLLLICCVLLWFGVYVALNLKFVVFTQGIFELEHIYFRDILLPKQILPAFIGWNYLFFSIGIAGSVSTFYLMIRRNKDDYGRDYYKFSIPVSAKWISSYLFGLTLTIVQTWMVYGGIEKISYNVFYLLGALILLIGIELVLGVKLIKNSHPIRLKEVMIINPILSLLISLNFVMLAFKLF